MENENKCVKCPDNCKECNILNSKLICLICNKGFALHYTYICHNCSKFINDCLECHYGN